MRRSNSSKGGTRASNQATAAKTARRAPLMMALEPRLMFDGAVASSAHALQAEHHDVHVASAAERPVVANGGSMHPVYGRAVEPAAPLPGPAVVFVDSRVEDSASLLKGLTPGTEIVYLRANKDGLQQIAGYLSHHHEVSSVEIIAHGEDGNLFLGNTDLTAGNINTFARSLGAIGKDLRAGADILVYACNTAADARGLGFVETLAKDTGHVVAASSNVTGSGGDWNLEVTTGTVTAKSVLSTKSEALYTHTLGTSTAGTAADLNNDIALADLDLVGNDLITLTSDITYASAADAVTITHAGTGTLTIDGGGHTINANYLSRVLSVTAGTVVLENVTLEHGLQAGSGGTVVLPGASGLGGGIYNAGTLTLLNVVVTQNVATGGGGVGTGVLGAGGGGGSGAGGVGGAAGGLGASGSGSSGGKGSGTGGGLGGTSSGGGVGGTPTAGGAIGGAGATATSAGVTAGGGGGGAGYVAGNGASGGNAAGGIYNAGTGTLFVVGTTAITNNVAAAGGGGGGVGLAGLAVAHGGLGGQGVGGILNATNGKVYITPTAYSAMTGNVGTSGTIGGVTGGASNTGFTSPASIAKINASSTVNTTFAPPTVSSVNIVGGNANKSVNDQFVVTFSEAVTGVNVSDFALQTTGTAGGTIVSVTGSGTTYTVNVNPTLGDGTLGLGLTGAAVGIKDSAGNPVAGGYNGGQTYTIDHTPPTASSITLVGNATNNAASESYTVTFSEPVTGVDVTDFNLVKTGTVAGAITGISGSGTTYTLTVTGVTGNGTLELNLNASGTGITDASGNALIGGALLGPTYLVDHTQPSVTAITTVGNATNNATTEQFNVTFSEPVTGVLPIDFTLTNTGTSGGVITAVAGSGSNYVVTVSSVIGDGTMRLDYQQNVNVIDAAGNFTTGGYTGGQVYTVEHTPPVATITSSAANPNNAATETFVVNFSENVTGVDTSDFTLLNTGTVHGTVASVTAVSGSSYSVLVNNVTGDGTMQLNLNAANTGIADAAGNAYAGGALGPIYGIEHTKPSVTAITTVGSTTNNATSEQFNVTFSEPVTGVVGADFALTNTGTAGALTTTVTGSGSNYVVTVGGAFGDGTMRLDYIQNLNVTDAAGNLTTGGYTSGQVYTVEHTPPVATSITAVGANPSSATTEQYTVNFSENVTGVDTSDFTLVKTGTVGGTIASVSGSGAAYTVTVSNVTGNGTMQLNLNATGTGITDTAGNAILLGDTGQIVNITHTLPAVTSIVAVGASPTNASSDQFTVTFSENVTGVNVADFSLHDTGTAGGTITSVTGSGNTYTVLVSPVVGDGTMRLDLNALNTVVDATGNVTGGGYTGGQTITIDHTAPVVSSITTASSSPSNLNSDQFTVNFSENVTGVDASDFSLATTGTVGGTIASVTPISGSSYTVAVTGVSGTGTLQVNLNGTGTGISDTAGNAILGGALGQILAVNTVKPTVTSISTVGANPNNAYADQFTVTFSENVSGVNAADFALTNTGSVAGVISSVTGSGNTYTVSVDPVSGNGTMRLDVVAPGVGIADAAGNGLAAGYSGGQVYVINHTPPTADSIVPAAGDTLTSTSDQFTVTFSEGVTGVDAGDFNLTTTGGVMGTITSVTPVAGGAPGSTYAVTVDGVHGNGSIQVNLNTSGTGITDLSGNPIANGGLTGTPLLVDATAPSVTSITTANPSPNNASSEVFTVNFSESVTGVSAADFTAVNTNTVADTSISVAGSGSTYTVTVGGVTGDGTMRLDLAGTGAGITDAGGHPLSGGYTAGQTYTIEHTAPVVSSITTVGASPSNATSEQFNVTFSEAVTGVDASDFTAVGGTVQGPNAGITVSGSGSAYVVTVNGVTGDGTLGLNLNASGTGITDAATNAINGGYTAGQTYVMDHTAPVVSSIVLAGPQTNDATSETYTVNFSENVTGVRANDFTLTDGGTANGAITSVTPVAGSSSAYTVTVGGVVGDGTLRLDVNTTGSAITDAAGNAFSAGFATGPSYSVDHTPPIATAITTVGNNPNNLQTETFTVNFSENVTGVDITDFTLVKTGTVSGTIGSVTAVSPVAGAAASYTVTVTGVNGDGQLQLDLNAAGTGITDTAGNPIVGGFVTGTPYTIQHSPPTVTSIDTVGASTNNATSEQFTVNFSENVTGVDASDFTLTDGNTAHGTIGTVSGSGSTYTVTVNGVTGDGSMRLDLNPSGTGIMDAAHNSITTGYTAGQSYTIDHTPPAVSSITLAGTSPNNATSDTYNVTFSENVSGVTTADFALAASGTAAGSIASVSGSGSNYSVVVNNVTGDGTLRLDLNGTGTGITDAAGNSIAVGYTSGQAYGIEHTPPAVTSINTVGASTNNAGSEQFTVTFSENVTNVDLSDFALTTTGSVTGSIASISGSGSSYVVTVNSVAGDGTMRLDLNPSGTGITDAAGNGIGSGYTSGQLYTIEHTPPAVSSIVTVGNATNNAGSEVFTVTFSENVSGVATNDFVLNTTGNVAGNIASVSGSGNTYSVTVNNVTGDGTMRLDLNGSGTGITDAAGNGVGAGYSGGQVYTIEHTPPSVSTINTVGSNPNNASSEQFTVNFSEPVTGVVAGDFVLANTGSVTGSIATVSGSGSTYTVTVNGVSGDGSMRLDLNGTGAGITDGAGNAITSGFNGGEVFQIGHTAPTVSSISLVGSSPNNAGTEQFTVNFSENVTGVNVGDFVLTNSGSVAGSIASVSGSGSTYTVTVNNVTGDGTMRLDLNGSATGITDGSGNSLSGAYTSGQTVSLDHSGPTVSSIDTAGNTTNNATSEQFTVTFSENVSGVDVGDFTLTSTGSVAGSIASVTSTGSGNTYTVVVNNVTGDGTMRLDLNSSGTGITDASGNAINAGFTAGQNYTIEHTPPAVASINLVGPATNNANSEQFAVNFSENVGGVVASDFVLTNGGTAAGTIASVSGSGSAYVVTVNGVTGDGTMRLDLNGTGPGITDAANNPVAATFTSGSSYTLEHTPPAVSSINTVGANPNNGGTEQFTVNFSENVTGVDASDFALTTTGAVTGTIGAISGSGSTYTVNVNGVSGNGTLRLDLNASGTGIADAAANPISGGYTNGEVYVLGHAAPTVSSIALVGTSPNNSNTEQFTVTFSENVTGVAAGDFVLANTGTVAGSIATVSGGGNTYTVTVNGVTGDGTMRLDLAGSGTGITDGMGNAIVGAYTNGQTVSIGQTLPMVTSVTAVGPSPNNAHTETFTVNFSENVTGVAAGDFVLSDTGTVAGQITSVSGSGSTYTVTVGNVTGDGTMRLDLSGSATGITDAFGNAPAGGYSSGQPITIDHIAPTVSSVVTVMSPSNGSSEQYTVQFSENVTGVDVGDFALTATGSAAGTISSVTGSGSTYIVTVNNVTGDGTLRLDLNAAGTGITDTAGNAIAAGYTAGQAGVVEHSAPTVTSVVAVGPNPSNASTEQFTVTFSEDVTGVSAGDFLLAETGTAAGTIGSVTGSGHSYTVTVNGVSGDGTLRLDLTGSGTPITDAAGNVVAGAYSDGTPLVVEHTGPVVLSVGAPASGTYVIGQGVDFTVNYGADVIVNSAGGVPYIDVTLDTGGTVRAYYVAGSGTTALTFRYTVAAGGLDTNGVVLGSDIVLNGGSIDDAAGNTAGLALNGAASTDGVLIDGVAPTVTSIASEGSAPSNASSFTYTVTFSENVSGLNASDFVLTTTGSAAGTIGTVTPVNGSTYLVTVTGVSGDGTLRLDVVAADGNVKDGAGNSAGGGYTAGTVTTVDHSGPTVTDVGMPPDNTYVAGETIEYTVTFGEPVTVDTQGGSPSLVLVFGGATHNATYVGGSGTNTITFSYTVGATDQSNGGVTVGGITLNGGKITDLAGNGAALVLTPVPKDTGIVIGGALPVVQPPQSGTAATVDYDRVEQDSDAALAGASNLSLEPVLTTDVQGFSTSDFVTSSAPFADSMLSTGVNYPTLTEPLSGVFAFTVPLTSFQFDPGSVVTVHVALANGQALPSWLSFDPSSGKFEGSAPAGWTAPLNLIITARDQNGGEAMLQVEVKFAARTAGRVFGVDDAAPLARDTLNEGRELQTVARTTRHQQRDHAKPPAKLSLAQQFDRHGHAARQQEINALLRRAS